MTVKLMEAVPVTANERINDNHFRLAFRFPEMAQAARPGQFVTLTPAIDDFSMLRRPFSVHRVTNDGDVQVLVKIVGRGTRRLHELPVRSSLNVLGPLGDGVFQLDRARPHLLMVAGGIGVAPFLFLFETLPDDLQPELFFGGRTALDLPTHHDFEQAGLPVHLATEDGSLGRQGLVTAGLIERLDHLEHDRCQVMACGPNPMLKAVAAICADRGVPCQVSLESMMACGVGSCRGCVVKVAAPLPADGIPFLRVCHEGPVFAAGVLDWEGIA